MAVEFKDYYRILGVDRSADEKTIKSAYRKLARKYHPTSTRGRTLASGDRRGLRGPLRSRQARRYDTLGPDWQRYAQQGAPTGAAPEASTSSTAAAGTSPSSFGRSSAMLPDRAGAGAAARAGAAAASKISSVAASARHAPAARRGRPAGVEISLERPWRDAQVVRARVGRALRHVPGQRQRRRQALRDLPRTGWQRAASRVDVRIPAGVRTGQKVRVSGEGSGGTAPRRPLPGRLHRAAHAVRAQGRRRAT